MRITLTAAIQWAEGIMAYVKNTPGFSNLQTNRVCCIIRTPRSSQQRVPRWALKASSPSSHTSNLTTMWRHPYCLVKWAKIWVWFVIVCLSWWQLICRIISEPVHILKVLFRIHHSPYCCSWVCEEFSGVLCVFLSFFWGVSHCIVHVNLLKRFGDCQPGTLCGQLLWWLFHDQNRKMSLITTNFVFHDDGMKILLMTPSDDRSCFMIRAPRSDQATWRSLWCGRIWWAWPLERMVPTSNKPVKSSTSQALSWTSQRAPLKFMERWVGSCELDLCVTNEWCRVFLSRFWTGECWRKRCYVVLSFRQVFCCSWWWFCCLGVHTGVFLTLVRLMVVMISLTTRSFVQGPW